MAGTEQGGKADKHDDLHNGFDRCALAVFKSNFRSAAFQSKTRDQAEFSEFSVKRPFQNETSLTPTDHEPGQWFAAYADRGLLSLDRRHSAGHQTTEVELVKGRAPSLATVSRAYAQTRRER